jgi:hypothetical protein
MQKEIVKGDRVMVVGNELLPPECLLHDVQLFTPATVTNSRATWSVTVKGRRSRLGPPETLQIVPRSCVRPLLK